MGMRQYPQMWVGRLLGRWGQSADEKKENKNKKNYL